MPLVVLIDELVFYSVGLAPDQIERLYRTGQRPNSERLVGFYPMNTSPASTNNAFGPLRILADQSGQNNHMRSILSLDRIISHFLPMLLVSFFVRFRVG